MKAEPGAVENRLSINPADFPEIEDWEDGQSYEIKIGGTKTRMTQISTGEFEVEAPRQQSPDDDVQQQPKRTPRSTNPAVASLIEEKYA